MIDEARWRQARDLKVFGYIEACRAFYAAMRERDAGRWKELVSGLPHERPVVVDEVANVAVFVAPDCASCLSAIVINVDGGHSSRGSAFWQRILKGAIDAAIALAPLRVALIMSVSAQAGQKQSYIARRDSATGAVCLCAGRV